MHDDVYCIHVIQARASPQRRHELSENVIGVINHQSSSLVQGVKMLIQESVQAAFGEWTAVMSSRYHYFSNTDADMNCSLNLRVLPPHGHREDGRCQCRRRALDLQRMS